MADLLRLRGIREAARSHAGRQPAYICANHIRWLWTYHQTFAATPAQINHAVDTYWNAYEEAAAKREP